MGALAMVVFLKRKVRQDALRTKRKSVSGAPRASTRLYLPKDILSAKRTFANALAMEMLQ
jgi:hypothetical protein